MTANKIQCPHCGCDSNEFDIIEHLDAKEDEIKDLYSCLKCGKKSIRCYKFIKWENPTIKKKNTGGFFTNTNVSSLPKGL